MASKLIHLRVPDILYKKAKKISKESGYRNVQEFTLESVRDAIQEHYKQQGLKTLDEEFGKYKGKIKRPTKEEREKIFEEFVEEKKRGLNLFRKYGLDKV